MYIINTQSTSASIAARKAALEARIQRGNDLMLQSQFGQAEAVRVQRDAEAMLQRIKAANAAAAHFNRVSTREEARVDV